MGDGWVDQSVKAGRGAGPKRDEQCCIESNEDGPTWFTLQRQSLV